MENVNGLNKVWGTLHCDKSPGGTCDETNGLSGNLACSGSTCQGGFHTYTFEVDRSKTPEALRWYLDGKLFWQIVQTNMSTAVWEKTVHGPVFILLNMAMGGSFPDGVYGSTTPLANTTSGGVYSIEYVAVYNK
jgi:beta-glucanase (GH16 family)